MSIIIGGGAPGTGTGGGQTESEVAAQIAIETAARQHADSGLQSHLTTTTAAIGIGDVALGERIDTEVETLETADASLASVLVQEASRSRTAETALQASIDLEAATRASEDRQNNAAITSEGTARTAADTALQHSITTEVTHRQQADATLNAKIAARTATTDADHVSIRAEIAALVIPPASTDGLTAEQVKNVTKGILEPFADTETPNSKVPAARFGDGTVPESALDVPRTNTQLVADIAAEATNRSNAVAGVGRLITAENTGRMEQDTEIRTALATQSEAIALNTAKTPYVLPPASTIRLGGILQANDAAITSGVSYLSVGDAVFPRAVLPSQLKATNDAVAENKEKLDTINRNANAYVLPKGSETTLGGFRVASSDDYTEGRSVIISPTRGTIPLVPKVTDIKAAIRKKADLFTVGAGLELSAERELTATPGSGTAGATPEQAAAIAANTAKLVLTPGTNITISDAGLISVSSLDGGSAEQLTGLQEDEPDSDDGIVYQKITPATDGSLKWTNGDEPMGPGTWGVAVEFDITGEGLFAAGKWGVVPAQVKGISTLATGQTRFVFIKSTSNSVPRFELSYREVDAGGTVSLEKSTLVEHQSSLDGTTDDGVEYQVYSTTTAAGLGLTYHGATGAQFYAPATVGGSDFTVKLLPSTVAFESTHVTNLTDLNAALGKKYFKSELFDVPSASRVFALHGLGRLPDKVWAVLHGANPLRSSNYLTDDSSGVDRGFGITATRTEIRMAFATSFFMRDENTGLRFHIDTAVERSYYKVQLYAEVF